MERGAEEVELVKGVAGSKSHSTVSLSFQRNSWADFRKTQKSMLWQADSATR
jgi:hypothetical protein